MFIVLSEQDECTWECEQTNINHLHWKHLLSRKIPKHKYFILARSSWKQITVTCKTAGLVRKYELTFPAVHTICCHKTMLHFTNLSICSHMLFFKTEREQCYTAHQRLICMQCLLILHLLRPPKFCLLYVRKMQSLESILLGLWKEIFPGTHPLKINREVYHIICLERQLKILVRFSKGW